MSNHTVGSWASPVERAARQQANTLARLLDSALRVGTKETFGDRRIPYVLAMARTSPAEFRECFAEPEELWQAVADALSNDLIAMIEATAGEFVDAAKRIECGVRHYLHEARDNPVFARFIAHRGLSAAGVASLIHHYLPAHISSGSHTARFSDATLEGATDLIAGTTLAAVRRIAQGGAPADHSQRVALAILKSLGVPALQARRLVKIEVPQLHAPSGSLLARARLIRD